MRQQYEPQDSLRCMRGGGRRSLCRFGSCTLPAGVICSGAAAGTPPVVGIARKRAEFRSRCRVFLASFLVGHSINRLRRVCLRRMFRLRRRALWLQILLAGHALVAATGCTFIKKSSDSFVGSDCSDCVCDVSCALAAASGAAFGPARSSSPSERVSVRSMSSLKY